MATIARIEGRDISLPDALAAGNDAAIKAALVPFYPEMANADVKREVKDGNTIITLVKRAGTKGNDGSNNSEGSVGLPSLPVTPELLYVSIFPFLDNTDTNTNTNTDAVAVVQPNVNVFSNKNVFDELVRAPESINPSIKAAWDLIQHTGGNPEILNRPEVFLTYEDWLPLLDELDSISECSEAGRLEIKDTMTILRSSNLRSQAISNPKNIPIGF